jgi:DNA-binding NarL/FixJ family response regulator
MNGGNGHDSRVRVVIAGSNPLQTSVWSAAVITRPELELVGSATTLEDSLPLVPHSDIVLLSVAGHVETAVEWVRTITRNFPDSRILVAGIPHQEHIILGYIEAGASAYIPEDETVEKVLVSLPAALRGEALIAPDIAPALIGRLARLHQSYSEPETVGTRLEALTGRERQILELIARNMSNRDIADSLLIEVGTVKNHVHSILEKLSMESRHQAAAYFQGARDRGRPPASEDLSSGDPRVDPRAGGSPEGVRRDPFRSPAAWEASHRPARAGLAGQPGEAD